MARNWAKMSADAQRYRVSQPQGFIIESSRDELRDFPQGLQDA